MKNDSKYISPELEMILVNSEGVFCNSIYAPDNQNIYPWESEDDGLLLYGKGK